MKDIPSNNDDVIDSRDIIERLEELRAEHDELYDAAKDAQDALNNALDDTSCIQGEDLEDVRKVCDEAEREFAEWLDDYGEELKALSDLEAQASISPDWLYGETLVRDSYFTEYAQELAEECGTEVEPDGWPYYCIDWERAARDLKIDYMDVDFDGVTYWIRA